MGGTKCMDWVMGHSLSVGICHDDDDKKDWRIRVNGVIVAELLVIWSHLANENISACCFCNALVKSDVMA